MKKRTIEKILAGKHAAWCRSIEDEAVRKLAEQNTIVTGGSIVSLLQNEPYNDIDIYLRDAQTAFAIAQYYVKKLLENPPPAFKGNPTHTIDVSAIMEPPIAEGAEDKRLTGTVKGPQPARVRIVVKSAGIAGETKQEDYQYFEGVPAAQQEQLTGDYVDAAIGRSEGRFAAGQVTDTTEPEFNGDDEDGAGYEENLTALDETPAAALDDKRETKAEKEDAQKRGKYRVLFVTSNAITLSDSCQIVIRFQGEPDDIHRNFDYAHVLSHWCSWTKKLTLNPIALECVMNKELRYIGSLYPLCSVIRLRKFLSRGWTINAGQIVKMLWQVNQLNLSDPQVLEDQLVGVDSAYFSQVISALKRKMEKDAVEGQVAEVDGTYLMSLIDRIF